MIKTKTKNFSFEKRIIDVLLNTIKDNQVYLTKKENLPQLAKLGYMYNTMWYAGRICWGYNGILTASGKGSQCEDNPKYKIEMCEPKNEKIENLIYDAWGMHVSNDMQDSWKEFSTIVLQGKELSELEIKSRKSNKTFDEWVESLTDENHQYYSIYPDRRAVANHLLCTIGNGYGYKNGCVVEEAGGADEDISQYGAWENAIFREDINKIVNKIMNTPEAKETIQEAHLFIKKIINKRNAEDLKRDMIAFVMPYKEFVKTKKAKELHDKFEVKNKYHQYYPICNYSIISEFNNKTHPSYIKAGIEICKEIISHEKEERKENVVFAKKFLKKFDI